MTSTTMGISETKREKNILRLEENLFGLTDINLRRLIFRLNILTILEKSRKPWMSRAMEFDIVSDLLQSVYKEHNVQPSDIYNVDETEMDPNEPYKVLALRGKKQIRYSSSGEYGVLITMQTCVSAKGNFKHPMFVFPRKRGNPMLMDDALSGPIAF